MAGERALLTPDQELNMLTAWKITSETDPRGWPPHSFHAFRAGYACAIRLEGFPVHPEVPGEPQ